MATIECRNLNKKYGDVEVVPDFNIEIKDHEFIVFLGPSGCGKSTILRMVAGLESISGGTLSIGGRKVNDLEPRDRGIAMVFQNYALYPHMTIHENIAFGLKRLKVPAPEIERRVCEVIELLKLGPVRDRKPTELSGGQQQRVAIARAMIKTPDVFLFDEPLSNLDAKLRAHMRVEIARLHEQLKTTSIYVTHDQLEAMTLADRIVLLNSGRIEQIGTPEEIYEKPRTLFAAGFIGTPAMNLVEMEATKNEGGWLLSNGGLDLRISGKAHALRDGQKVTLGVRPSDLHQAQGGHEITLSGECERVEFHGDHVLASVRVGEDLFGSLLPIRCRPKEGQAIALAVDETAIHLFDRDTGLTLLESQKAAAA